MDENFYNLIIVGGGIAGLHTALRVIEQKPDWKICILERITRMGGRIKTIYDDTNTILYECLDYFPRYAIIVSSIGKFVLVKRSEFLRA